MINPLALITTLYLFAGILYLGYKKPHYSHTRHTISELGEKGGPNSALASFGLFLPTGILLLILSLSGENKTVQGFAACLSAGYLLSAFFPCDKGSPLEGGLRQQIHNFAGIVEYAGGAYFLYRAPEATQHLLTFHYKIVAAVVIICVIITSVPRAPVRGFTQRIAEVLLFASLLALTA